MGTTVSSNIVQPNGVLMDRIANEAPTEIIRYILEIAATEHQPTAKSLCLVSKQLRSWIEPIRYRTVVIGNEEIDRFNDMMQSRGSFLGANLRTLAVWSYEFVDTQALGQTCTKLHTLHVEMNNAGFLENVESYPSSIKQFSVSGPLLHVRLQNMPIFRSITHLVFVDDLPSDFPSNPDSFPQLTHFSCRYRTANFGVTVPMLADHLEWILGIVLRCFKMRMVVIVVQDTAAMRMPTEEEMRTGMFSGMAQQMSDSRVVLLVSQPNKWGCYTVIDDWDLDSPNSLWALADSKMIH